MGYYSFPLLAQEEGKKNPEQIHNKKGHLAKFSKKEKKNHSNNNNRLNNNNKQDNKTKKNNKNGV